MKIYDWIMFVFGLFGMFFFFLMASSMVRGDHLAVGKSALIVLIIYGLMRLIEARYGNE